MENNENLNNLIESFKNYREVLGPLQSSLRELVDMYNSLDSDMQQMSEVLNGNNKNKLDNIYSTLSAQSQKTIALSNNIDTFIKSSNKYTNDVSNLYKKFEVVENNISVVSELDAKAREQINKLEIIIQEKKINYNLKDLEKVLENYNNTVQKMTEFINKDVAQVLTNNTKKLEEIKKENELVAKMLKEEGSDIETLTNTYMTTNKLLSNMIEKEDVNEEYIFAILDKWANSRKVKIKK